jgi:uncharacterized RDD family membrane protein YckC
VSRRRRGVWLASSIQANRGWRCFTTPIGSPLTPLHLSASISLQSMSWYYGLDGRPQGPVEEATLEQLALTGVIEWTTPLWRTGMGGWQPFGEIFRRPFICCHECQKQVEQETAVRYRELSICPRCKASFFQKVREGLAREEASHYCGFWIRFCARLLDGLFLSVFTVPLSLINEVIIFRLYPFPKPGTGVSQYENPSTLGTLLAIQAAFVLIGLLISFAYEVYFVGRFGGTPGKLLLRMRIVRSDSSRLTYPRAAIRFFGKLLSDLTMYVGYIMVGFDSQRRALHDYIADTRVIKIE